MEDLFSLKDRRILVCGGTRGIGRAIAIQLSKAGAHVIANYVRDVPSAESLKNEAEANNWRLEIVRGDVTSAIGIDRLFDSLHEFGGELAGFIHCAATGVHRPFEELTTRHFDFTYNLNVRAFLEISRRCLPLMRAGSFIIGVSSVGAVRAVDQYALTGSSKGALESLVRHMAAELAPREIRVNCIAPGTVLSDAWKHLPDSEARLQHAEKQSPRGRLTTVEEVAMAAHFLCSDAANGIIGHTLVVDNGCRIME